MKFREIFCFEFQYQLSRYTTWLYFIVILAFAILSAYSMVDNVEKGEYHLNSPVIIAVITTVSSMFGLLLCAAISGNAAVRDIQTRMDPLIYTASLSKLTYLGARFLAVCSINLLVLVFVMILLMIVPLIPNIADLFIVFSAVSYWNTFLIFAIPNVFITTGILFSIGIFSRGAMAGFLAAAVLFFITLITVDIFAGELGMWELAKKIDLSGLTILKEIRFTQTPLQMKEDQVLMDSYLWINRLIWMGVAATFLSLAYLRFGFVHRTSGNRKKSAKRRLLAAASETRDWSTPILVPADKRIYQYKTELQQAVFLTFKTFRGMIRAKIWLLIPATAAILIMMGEEVLEGQLGVPMFPTTWRIVEYFNFFIAVKIMLAVVITFYVGELVWKERDSRINEMADAAPVPTWVLFFSKFTGLFLLLLLMQAILMVSGIIIQLIHGFDQIDLWLYFRVFFGLSLIDHLLFTILALTIHVLVNQKYLGYLLVFIAYYYMNFSSQLGLQHHMLIYGSAPGWSYSEMNGFGSYVEPWLWFKLYWAGWAILFAIVSQLLWNRGNEHVFSKRWKQAKGQLTGKTAKAGIPLIAGIILVGGFLFYNTNILNNYITADGLIQRRVLYESLYRKYKYVPQPLLTGIKLNGEIYPEKGEVHIHGIYTHVNKSSVAIDTIHVATTSGMETVKMGFSKRHEDILIDNDLGHRIYKLAKPLLPGDSLSLTFSVRLDQKGFSNNGVDKFVLENGSYLGYHQMPAIGYEAGREISAKEDREKYGLPPQSAIRSLYDKEARMDAAGEEMITFEAILGTTINQTAVTAGTLHRTWVKNNRRYSRYASDVPIRHNYEIFSAEYQVYESKWKDVEIQIFHHPAHTKNLERMVKGVSASLDYFSKNFSPYPHSQIRLVEYPGSGVNLNGNPVTMSYSEGFSFFDVESDHREMDFPFAVVSHEVAHQWWGNIIRPAYVEGAPLLTESLAWYSAMMVVQETFGEEHLALLIRVMRQEYLNPRSAADLPLLKSTDKFNGYRKGPFAMYTLKKYVGEEKINKALQNLIQKFGSAPPPLPVSLDLYAELQSVTPDSLQYLLKDLFERNTFWELKAEKASVKPSAEGKWEVNFDVVVKKLEIDETGMETEYPMNDFVEIGVYANSPEYDLGKVLYLKKHRLTSGKQTISITVDKEPDLAGIDPYRLLIDREPSDNFSQIP